MAQPSEVGSKRIAPTSTAEHEDEDHTTTDGTPARTPTILATSMGLNRAREPWRPGPVFDYAIDLARTTSTPRLCVLTTAGGDQQRTVDRLHDAFGDRSVDFSTLSLFDKPNVDDVAGHLRSQDVIWVDRGSVINTLAVWRAHDLDAVLRDCWRSGVVLAGESAGSLCWFSGGITDSFGPVQPVRDGLGIKAFSNTVHYAERSELFRQAIQQQTLPAGYATDAGAGLHFEHTELIAAISDRKNAGAYRLDRNDDGTVTEKRLEVRRLKRT